MRLVYRPTPDAEDADSVILCDTTTPNDIGIRAADGFGLTEALAVVSQAPGGSRNRVNDVRSEVPQLFTLEGLIEQNLATQAPKLIRLFDTVALRQVPDGQDLPASAVLDYTPDGEDPPTYRRDVLVRSFSHPRLQRRGGPDHRWFTLVLESHDAEWYAAEESEEDLTAGNTVLTITGDRMVYPRFEFEASGTPTTAITLTGTTDGGRTITWSATLSSPDTLVLDMDPDAMTAVIGSTRMDHALGLTDRPIRLFPAAAVTDGENTVHLALSGGTPTTMKAYWRERWGGVMP